MEHIGDMSQPMFASMDELFRVNFTAAAYASSFAPKLNSHVLVVTAPPSTPSGSPSCVAFAVLFDSAFMSGLGLADACWQVRNTVGADDTYVGFLCVAAAHRRKGLATALVATLKQRAAAAGKGGSIWLESYTGNTTAHAWYKATGFAEVAELMAHGAGRRTQLLCWSSAVVIDSDE